MRRPKAVRRARTSSPQASEGDRFGCMFAVVWHYWIAVVLVLTAVVPATINEGVRRPRLRRVLRQSEPNKVCCFIDYCLRGNGRRYQAR